MIAALCTFLALLAAPTLGQDSQVVAPPSPCPTVFRYDPPGSKPGWWSGVINLSSDFLLHSLWLDIVLDSQAITLLHKTAEANTQNFKIFRIEDESMQIQPGVPTSLRFSVQYDTNDRFPRLQAIKLNGIIICNGLLPEGQTDPGVKTNINTNKRPVINPSKQSINPVSPIPDNRPDPGNMSNTAGDISSGSSGQKTQCGTPALKSKWPWVAALFDLQKGYVCGGTLLTNQHVITAAKCVLINSSPDKPVRGSSLVVRLGNHDMDSVVGVQISLVQEIIVSSDYSNGKHVTYNGLDVALLVLHEPVTYTDWVKPVCLWPASQIDLDNVIGKKGWLVGWGYDEKNILAEQLSAEEIPVVPQQTCFKSEGYAYYNITQADNNYCAGIRQETVLCKGVDRGNGMVFKMGNSWYLRGHVSFYLTRKLKTKNTCDPTGFFQFADLAKGLPWMSNTAGDISSGSSGQKTQCGTPALKSKWPWVAALFDLQKGYVCGGTLLTNQHVITAAKCVLINSSPDKPVRGSSLVVRLGNHDMDSVVGVQISLVQEIIVSSDYSNGKHVTYNGLDVALLVLHEPVTYTDWVKPVCLWPASQIDLDNVIGKKGWLVGWGYDEKNILAEQLSAEEIPVVPQQTCFKSEGYAYYNITQADNNYCAGIRQETVLCKGVDRGNGMVFKMGNSWYLRGHVSFYLTRKLKTKNTCDPTGFFQFADLAKGLPWMYGIVSSYL